jgi:Ca2+-binding RTX toxin-like protein
LQGSIGDDSLYGDEGDDELTGADGNDKLYGGPDNDVLLAGIVTVMTNYTVVQIMMFFWLELAATFL